MKKAKDTIINPKNEASKKAFYGFKNSVKNAEQMDPNIPPIPIKIQFIP